MKLKRLTTMAMLIGLAFIFSYVEAIIPIPIPIPGVKLGVANVITLFALWTLGWREAGAILLIRVVLGNTVAGSFSAMLFSLAGGCLCWVVMSLLKPLVSIQQTWVMSIFGAIAHNAGQLAVAVFISGTVSILVYAPVLMIAGIVTGFFTGVLAQLVLEHMQRL